MTRMSQTILYTAGMTAIRQDVDPCRRGRACRLGLGNWFQANLLRRGIDELSARYCELPGEVYNELGLKNAGPGHSNKEDRSMKSLRKYSLSLSLLIVGASESRGQGPVPLSVLLHDPVPQAEAKFGNDVLIVDLDANGIRDLVIGSPGYSVTLVTTPLVSAGQLVIRKGPVLGPPSWTRISEPVIAGGSNPGPEANAEFGFRIVSGDFNADGHIDLAVSAPGADLTSGGGYTNGEVFILYGPWNLTVVPPALPYSQAEVLREPVANRNAAALGDLHGDRFGHRLAVGEVDIVRDRGIDLIVGAPWSSATVSGFRYKDRGEAWFFHGALPGTYNLAGPEEVICHLDPHEQQFWGWDVECGNLHASMDLNGDDVAVAAYGYPGAGQCPIPPCPPIDFGFVHVFIFYPFTGFAGTPVDIYPFMPGPAGSDEGTFGWELEVGISRADALFESLAVGMPFQPLGGSLAEGVVWMFPGGTSFGPANSNNSWTQLNTTSLSLYERFGGGIEFIDYEGGGTTYPGEELFVASEWFDYGTAAAAGNHGEGRCFLIGSGNVRYDQFLLSVNDATPEERPESELNQFLGGFGSAAVTGGRLNFDLKEDVAIGNASATYGTLAHAGEVQVMIWQ